MPAAATGPVLLADYPPAATFGPRLMRDYEFVWLLRGSAVWSVGDDDHLLRPGTLALARPGMVDCYHWDPEKPSTHAYVHFGLSGVGHLPEEWPAVRSLSALPVLDGICRYLLQLAGDPSAASAARRDQLLELMTDIFVAGPVPRSEPGLPPIMITIAGRVRADWDRQGIRPLSVDTLADVAGISAGHLHRLFREHVGHGPRRALELIRLARLPAPCAGAARPSPRSPGSPGSPIRTTSPGGSAAPTACPRDDIGRPPIRWIRWRRCSIPD